MDLRDEVAGTEGTIRLDHFLRTGFEMFTASSEGGYVAEKAEGQKGWLFPVGDEAHALGYVHMFQDMLDAREAGRAPMETFYDGYVVNAIIDACYKSMKSGRWEPVELDLWPGPQGKPGNTAERYSTAAKIKKVSGASTAVPNKAGIGAGPQKKAGRGARKSLPKGPGRAQEAKTVAGKGKTAGAAIKPGVVVIKTERLPDGRTKTILKETATGRIFEKIG
jgi:hypothetical protein